MVYSKTFHEHLDRLREVSNPMREAGLKLKPMKCQIFRHSMLHLGHVVSADGVKTDPENTKTVAEWPMPVTVKQLRSSLVWRPITGVLSKPSQRPSLAGCSISVSADRE